MARIKAAIDTALADEEISVVEVTGRFAGADFSLEIAIPADKKVVWDAEYSGSVYNSLIAVSGEGEIEIAQNADIQNDDMPNSGTALGHTLGVACKKFTMNGGRVSSENSNALLLINGAVGVINDGILTANAEPDTIFLMGASLSIHGGTITGGGTAERVIYVGSSTIYVTGGTIEDGGIWNGYNTVGLFTGGSLSKFRTSGDDSFILDYDLFMLDQPDFGGYIYSAAEPHEGTVTATFPDVLTITAVTASPAAALHTFGDNAVIFEGIYNHADISLTVSGTVGGLSVTFTTLPFGVNLGVGGGCPHEIDMEKNCVACLACGEVLFERTCTKSEPCMWHGSVPTGVVDVTRLWWVMVGCGLVAVGALAVFVASRRRPH